MTGGGSIGGECDDGDDGSIFAIVSLSIVGGVDVVVVVVAVLVSNGGGGESFIVVFLFL